VVLVAAGVVVAGITTGRNSAAWFDRTTPTWPATSPASGSPGTGSGGSAPAPAGAIGGSHPTNPPLDPAAVAAAVDPGVVDITSQLGFDGTTVSGTGMVLGASGVVLTNNHVVDRGTSISVTDIGNGQTYAASVVGTDPSGDVAVLQLSGVDGLPTVRLGNSADLVVGQAVVAIGNAWGAGGAPASASGTIVALDQAVNASDASSHSVEHLAGMVETDATLRPGDSGGPLVDARGEVVGMDSAASGSFELQGGPGNGFAIPIDRALTIAQQILAGGASDSIRIGTVAYLGVTVQAPTGPIGLGIGAAPGALVTEVVPGSPADQAGIVAGDQIVSLGGVAVDSPATLQALLETHRAGDDVEAHWTDALGLEHAAVVQLVAGPAG